MSNAETLRRKLTTNTMEVLRETLERARQDMVDIALHSDSITDPAAAYCIRKQADAILEICHSMEVLTAELQESLSLLR